MLVYSRQSLVNLLVSSRLRAGVKAFEPGLLAKANRGILYVDEVNLLDDHLVGSVFASMSEGICRRRILSFCYLALA